MKKLLCIAISAAITLPYFLSTANVNIKAYAENGYSYMRVITEDTPFFASPTESAPLFYLPYTYYVKVIGKSGNFTRVEINGTGYTAALDGYVPSDMLFYDGLEVKNPFVELEITTASTAVLYSDSELTNVRQYLFPERNMRYYGFLLTANGSRIYYVSYNDRLGYVKESDIIPFAIPNHPNELTFIVKEPEPEQNPTGSKNDTSDKIDNNGLRIAIIGCLSFAGIIALLVAFKGKPRQKTRGYYDESDYE